MKGNFTLQYNFKDICCGDFYVFEGKQDVVEKDSVVRKICIRSNSL